MTNTSVLIMLLVVGGIWTLIWFPIVTSTKYVEGDEAIDAGVAKLRRYATWPFILLMVVGVAISLYYMPYPQFRAKQLGEPEFSVQVDSGQWYWLMDEHELPVDTVIEFIVNSDDVNHNFAVYDESGELLTQVQAMPGHENVLLYRFDEPGRYTIRCLEFCGEGHHGMLSSFNVS